MLDMNVTIGEFVELERIVERIHANYQKSALALIEIGHDLIKAKELLPHGSWGDWLQDNFGLSQSSALNFMRVSREFGDKADILNGCDFGARVLYALAAPSTPDVVRDVVIHEAKQAEPVGVERVAEVKAVAQGEPGIYYGEDVRSLVGEAVLEAGDECEITGITFVSNPQLVYVKKGGETFLVDRDDLEPLANDPSVEVEGNRIEIVDPSFDRPAPSRSVEEESDRRAESLGLPRSRVQVLPDVDRHEAPGEVDDRPGAHSLDGPFNFYVLRVGGRGNIHELISTVLGRGWAVEVIKKQEQEVGDDD